MSPKTHTSMSTNFQNNVIFIKNNVEKIPDFFLSQFHHLQSRIWAIFYVYSAPARAVSTNIYACANTYPANLSFDLPATSELVRFSNWLESQLEDRTPPEGIIFFRGLWHLKIFACAPPQPDYLRAYLSFKLEHFLVSFFVRRCDDCWPLLHIYCWDTARQ